MAQPEVEDLAFQRKCTAIHEAAHFVIYHDYGVEALGIYLRGTSSGAVISPSGTQKTIGDLFGLLAGKQADIIFLKDHPDKLEYRRPGWDDDLRKAEEVLSHLGEYRDYSEAIEVHSQQVARMLADENTWERVRVIADLLLSKYDPEKNISFPFVPHRDVKVYVSQREAKEATAHLHWPNLINS